VFKFPKVSWTNYKNEARALEALKNFDFGVEIQSVNHLCPDGKYISLNGIIGESIKNPNAQIGAKIGRFLKKLHGEKINTDYGLWINVEMEMWKSRYRAGISYFKKHFSATERKILDKLVLEHFPAELKRLGEDLVFSHHDLNLNNVLLCKNGKIGVIDFEHAGIYDRATDFMCMPTGEILNAMIKNYGADEILKQKIMYRRQMRTIVIARDHDIDPERVREIINLYRFYE
jgi:thiamine kinase-like enzyme